MRTTELLSNIYTETWSHPGADLEFTFHKLKVLFTNALTATFSLLKSQYNYIHYTYIHFHVCYTLIITNVFYGAGGMLLVGEQTD